MEVKQLIIATGKKEITFTLTEEDIINIPEYHHVEFGYNRDIKALVINIKSPYLQKRKEGSNETDKRINGT